MSINLSNIRWRWVILGIVIAFVIAYGSSICVVTSYATVLAFQARGTPDATLINDFAARVAEGVAGVFIGVGTLVGGLLAARKAKEDAYQNGLMVGLVTGLIDLALSILGGVSLWSLVSLALAVGGGWLGGRLSRK